VQAPSADAQEGITRAAEGAIEANFRVKGFDVPFCSEVEIARKQMGVVNSVDLENRLGDVETDCRDRLHGSLL
jgi:hypothetical protein